MNTITKPLMPARVVIGFGDRQFHIFADEITTFLVNCEGMGLTSVEEIIAVVETLTCEPGDNPKLIEELALLLRGLIYES